MSDLESLKSEKLHFTTKLAYGAGDFGPAITANILGVYLLFFFTNIAGLPAFLAGSVLMIGKIFDAINDPIIGIMSDRTRSRWGRRLPWMLFGIVPFGIIYYLQWLIPDFGRGNIWALFSYYVLIGIVFNIAYTAINLPYQALTPELTLDYNERTSLNSFRFAFSIGGSIISIILFIILSSIYPNDSDQETKFLLLGIICVLMSIIATIWCCLGIQERGTDPLLNLRQKKQLGTFLLILGSLASLYGIISITHSNFLIICALILGLQLLAFGYTLRFSKPEIHLMDDNAVRQRIATSEEPSIPYKEQLRIVFNNRPFLYIIGIYLCSWIGVQLTASILVYFVVSWMELPNKHSGFAILAVQGTALIMLFFWQAVSNRLDKKTVYFLGMIFWIIAQIGLFSLQPGQVIWMYFFAIIAGFGVSVAYLIPWSMVPDVIELDELETGKRREGVFYAFMVLLQKLGLALGLFLVGIALQAAGFKEAIPGQPVPVQPESALFAIRLAVAPLPAFFLIIGVILAYFYPITRQKHAEILLKLQERRENKNLDNY